MDGVQRTIIARCIPRASSTSPLPFVRSMRSSLFQPARFQLAVTILLATVPVRLMAPSIRAYKINLYTVHIRETFLGNKLLPLFKILVISNWWDASGKHIVRFSFCDT
jgi:hypothetical protein